VKLTETQKRQFHQLAIAQSADARGVSHTKVTDRAKSHWDSQLFAQRLEGSDALARHTVRLTAQLCEMKFCQSQVGVLLICSQLQFLRLICD
jgi:hypothetical protein